MSCWKSAGKRGAWHGQHNLENSTHVESEVHRNDLADAKKPLRRLSEGKLHSVQLGFYMKAQRCGLRGVHRRRSMKHDDVASAQSLSHAPLPNRRTKYRSPSATLVLCPCSNDNIVCFCGSLLDFSMLNSFCVRNRARKPTVCPHEVWLH